MDAASTAVAVIGAGGKMGMRISDNLQTSAYQVLYAETHPPAQARVRAAGRSVTPNDEAVPIADVVILAVPDVHLGRISEAVVPVMKPGSTLLTLDPAASYAGLIARRDDISYGCAHPCHPSVFLERTTPEEYADTFGGIAAPQHVVAAFDRGDDAARQRAEVVMRTMYAPVLEVHWATVEQLCVLEPTLVETVTCMIGGLLAEALDLAVNQAGVPEPAARAMLLGHVQVALANTLRGSHPFSDACMVAMAYGREAIVRQDWRRIFEPAELDRLVARMLEIDKVRRAPVLADPG
jgi:D-apionate oxidoisomerase